MFVESHVKEILKEKNISFRYILSEENPTDIATQMLLKLLNLIYGGTIHLGWRKKIGQWKTFLK